MTNPVSLSIRDGIAVIAVDNPPVNALSHAVRAGLVDAIGQVAADPQCRAAVLACKGRTFIAGADISEFGKPLAKPGLNTVVNTIEACDKPVVAAIHGTALGGGFEVALGCHYRVASPGAAVGLPEVKLGLLPGAGGTQRLPRLIGIEPALDAMLAGKPVPAAKALELGAIDAVVDGDLVDAAVAFVERLLNEAKGPRRLSEVRIDPATVPDGSFDRYRETLAKTARGYFAPTRIVEAVAAAIDQEFADGLANERRLFEACMASPQSAALRYLFFAERAAAKVDGLSKDTPVRAIERVAIIGAGTMGGGIGMNFASRGIPVRIVDVDEAAIRRGLDVVRGNYGIAVKKGRMSEGDLERTMENFIPTTDYAALADADLVIEAVFENMALKRRIFGELDRVCRDSAILATNTSTLDVDEIAAVTGRPGDVLGLHFFSPANVMRLLEIVRGAKTSDEVLATALKLARSIGKIGVVSGVCYGFIGNRMLEGYSRESNRLLLEGASGAEIDAALREFGFAMGPVAVWDLAGIDVGARMREERRAAGALPDDPSYGRVFDRLAEMGRFGQKTGAGYYRYEAGSRKPVVDPDIEALVEAESSELGIERRRIDAGEIVERCLYALINEGAKILDEGIAQRASDIDVVYINGYGFPPYRGGPMFYADTVGLDKVYEGICRLRDAQPVDYGYWEPAPLLEKLARTGGRFTAG